MTDDQIKYMVDRFLAWKLPDNFNPDCGVSFKRTFNEHTTLPMKYEPSGTNLLDAAQATAMVRHMIEGMPRVPAQRAGIDRDAVAEAHEHIKEAIDGMESGRRIVPIELHKAAHALHHALNDAPPQAANPLKGDFALKALGSRLADLLDADHWNNVEPFLLDIEQALRTPPQAAPQQELLSDIWFHLSDTTDPTLRKIADRSRELLGDLSTLSRPLRD